MIRGDFDLRKYEATEYFDDSNSLLSDQADRIIELNNDLKLHISALLSSVSRKSPDRFVRDTEGIHWKSDILLASNTFEESEVATLRDIKRRFVRIHLDSKESISKALIAKRNSTDTSKTNLMGLKAQRDFLRDKVKILKQLENEVRENNRRKEFERNSSDIEEKQQVLSDIFTQIKAFETTFDSLIKETREQVVSIYEQSRILKESRDELKLDLDYRMQESETKKMIKNVMNGYCRNVFELRAKMDNCAKRKQLYNFTLDCSVGTDSKAIVDKRITAYEVHLKALNRCLLQIKEADVLVESLKIRVQESNWVVENQDVILNLIS